MTREIARSDNETPTWEDTVPHFSISEKGNRITAPPLDAHGILGFVAVVAFVLWIPAATAGALYFHGLSQHTDPAFWQGVLIVLYTFLPTMLTDLTSDEARDRIGQKATANRVAAIPAFAGVGVGLLLAALRVDGVGGGVLALASVASSVGAALVSLAAWRGIRYTRKRQAWMAWLRHSGTRSPGILREVAFLNRWSSGQPQFRVIVEYASEAGPQWLTANMTTITGRVPQPGAAMLVSRAPHDPAAEPLIELDYADRPRFDPDHAKYEQPSAN